LPVEHNFDYHCLNSFQSSSNGEPMVKYKYKHLTSFIVAITILIAVSLSCNNSSSTVETPTSNTAAVTNSTSNAATAVAPSAPSNIAGTYDATGTNPDGGGAYKATLVVTPRDDVYQFSWDSGTSSYDGVGVMTENAVAVSYTEGKDGKGCGVVLYKINADGSLDGKSGYWGVNKAETERAVRTGGTDLDGKYTIKGTNPDGKDYTGTLDVAKDGSGYSFKWNAGTATTGFGIKAGNLVAVGFGGSKCAFVGYDVKADGTLDGKWGSQASNKFGTEVAKKR